MYTAAKCLFLSHNFIGCPSVLRADHGTENCVIAKVHIAFRMNHGDSFAGPKSFFYGPSTANIVRFLPIVLYII